MRLFVSEYVCSGAWPDPTLPESLAREGRAMLLALLEDAARNPEWDIHTTWDHRLGDFPVRGVSVLTVDGLPAEQAAFDRLARESDAAYVIAPELDDLLARRCQRVRELGGVSLNSSIPAISLCSDKLRLARALEAANVATLPTRGLDSAPVSLDFPLVVKPRFGAGCHETWLVETGRRFDEIRFTFDEEPASRQAIVQPFMRGMPVSVAAFVNDQGQVSDLGPLVEQLLSIDGRFRYLGGRIPAQTGCDDAIGQLASDAVSAVPGLCGYVGIDVLVPYQHKQPLLVEINPRLTTSYIGYRALAGENLADRVLQLHASSGSINWSGHPLLFTSHGSVNHTPKGAAERST